MIRCIVVDDEPLAREGLELLIKEVPFLQHISSFSSAIEAHSFLKSNNVDLMFLDIEMPALNGFDFLSLLKSDIKVIITSAYSDYALKSYDFDVLDYLTKPIRFERFYKAVSKILESKNYSQEQANTSENQEYIFIRSNKKFVKIIFEDIDYIEGLKDYSIIFMKNEKITIASNLKSTEEMFAYKYLKRVNKSYLVNIKKVSSFDNHELQIANFSIAIGDIYRDAFLNEISNLQIKRK